MKKSIVEVWKDIPQGSETGAEVHDIAAGEFRSSGTTIPTTAIIIRK